MGEFLILNVYCMKGLTMNDYVQKALRELEIVSLVKDVEKKLAKMYGAQQPECSNPRIHNGFWWVWVSYYGWIKISDLLQGRIA
jgi:hypothetical protein